MSGDARQRYADLTAQVGEKFDRIAARHRAQMQCGAGCSRCCQIRLAVTQIEAETIDEAMGAAEPALRERIAAREDLAGKTWCPALGEDGRCEIYEFRPLACRSYGAPIRALRAQKPIRLVVVDACKLNFEAGAALAAVPSEDVFDQEALSTQMAAIERAWCDERGLEPGPRIDLAELLSRPR
jgi:Fe-S-cluster containining protein